MHFQYTTLPEPYLHVRSICLPCGVVDVLLYSVNVSLGLCVLSYVTRNTSSVLSY